MKMEQKRDEAILPDLLSDKRYAHILFEVDPEINTLQKAKQIIEALGIQIIEIQEKAWQRIAMKLDVADMSEAALRLSENGFRKVEGYNPPLF
jgi:hypothetical protein